MVRRLSRALTMGRRSTASFCTGLVTAEDMSPPIGLDQLGNASGPFVASGFPVIASGAKHLGRSLELPIADCRAASLLTLNRGFAPPSTSLLAYRKTWMAGLRRP